MTIVNTHAPVMYHTPDTPFDTTLLAVLTSTRLPYVQYAAYIGLTTIRLPPPTEEDTLYDTYDADRAAAAIQIAAHGDKLSYRQALQHFPDLQEKDYRT